MPKLRPKVKIMGWRWARIDFLWLALAVAIFQTWPANSQEPPKETGKPVARPAETTRPADPTLAKPSATQGGPTTRSPQTGAAGANESARPVDPTSAKPSATQGRDAKTGDGGTGNVIQSIEVSTQAGTVTVRLGLKEALQNPPAAFTVKDPPRVALDFPNTANGLGKNTRDVNQGDLRTIRFGQSGGQTRVVFNLAKMLKYDTRVEGNTVVVTLQSAAARSPQTGAAGVSQSARANPDVVTLNFVNAEIEGVVKVVSEITGKNFVIDPRVKGTINIVSAKPLPRTFVYDVFLSALRLQGFAAVEDRGIVKILPEADAKLHSAPALGPGDKAGPAGDRIETRVFTLEYESAMQVLPILRPLIAPNNTITAYQNSNTLVITDYANNLQRLAKIIESIDQPSGTDPVVIPLQYASAVDVAAAVSRLLADSAQAQGATAQDPTQRFAVIADARSNSLLVRTGDPSRLTRLRKFVVMLDSPTNAGGNIHVVYLKNAEAVKLADTLRAIYQGDAGAAAGPRSGSAPSPLGAATAASMSTPAPGAAAAPAAQALYGATGGQSQGTAAAPGIIQADAATNSIIITAPDAIYNNLRAALDKLDVRRAQVYVEALIAELTADKAAEFGVQWQSLSGLGRTDTQGFGGTNFGTTGQNIIGLSQNPATAGPGLNVGVVNGRIDIPGVGQILNLGLLVRALETDANANILSTPTLLTLDNEEAAIVIGQNVPFVTGQYALTGAATTPTPFQTVERHDVGLTLRIKPQISEGGTVRLQIYQEVSSIQDQTNPAGVITNKRAVASTVLVDDGQIVVIGGLIQDTVKDGVQKVPVLGDIPLLGGLFRYKTRSHNKTNLMIFLRPTLVRDSQRADAFTGERYDYILGEQEKAKPAHDAILPDMASPTLPPKTAPATRPAPPLEIEVRPYRDEGRN
ncbi:MAG TPA: type II secretion system secretin GspD [Burkholderiales bacterium]|nr:type II secretion system secretin GspD [Burkholderiales bacterium]